MGFEHECESIAGWSAAVFGSVRGLAKAGNGGGADVTVVDGESSCVFH